MLAVIPIMAFAVVAQDSINFEADQMKLQLRQVISQSTVMGVRSAVMGPAVKGAPYSATEVAANAQTLSDGTNIERKTETRAYRDSEGRIRRETGDQVNIWDPVGGVSYFLDSKTQTAQQMKVGSYVGAGGGVGGVGFAYATGGTLTADSALPLPPPQSAFVFQGQPNMMFITKEKLAGKSEPLGSQTIEGVNATGTRMTSTIEAGAIGNDRPIQIVSESWYSAELQTMVKSTHSDPRMGQETFELMNVSRTEPNAYLFQVPAGYQIDSPK